MQPLKTRQRKEFKFPQGYGDNKIVLLVRDPWWIFAYWEVRRDREEDVIKKIEAAGDSPDKSVLRVYDVTDLNFNGKNEHSFFDIDLKSLANNWYINVSAPNRSWVVDIGVVSKKGDFYLLARSNAVKTPRFEMSDKLDAEWMMPEEEYWRMFGFSGSIGKGIGSLEVREMFKKRLQEEISSGAISSGASFYRNPAK